MLIPKPISLDELRKRSSISQTVGSSTPSRDQIKKEKQEKYAKKIAREKIIEKILGIVKKKIALGVNLFQGSHAKTHFGNS